MKHRIGNELARVGSLVLLFGASALVGCARASAPPPVSDAVAAPVPSETAAPSAEPPAPVPVASASSAPATSEDCSKLESSSDYLALPADARARSLESCKVKAELQSFVAARQACASASECTIVTGSCPFGCYVPVKKTSASEVAAKLEALGARLEKAGNRCVYRCIAPPAEACVEGRCSTAAQ